MSKYSYKLIDKEGKIKNGQYSAFTQKSAEKALSKDGSIVIFVSSNDSVLLHREIPLPWSGFSVAEKINFFRNLSMMSSAGISIVEALSISSEEIKSKRVKDSMDVMAKQIKNGQKLSSAMAQFPNYYPQFMVETIKTGEVSGKLTKALDRIATDLEKNAEIRRKIISAIMYPLIVVAVMIVILIVLLIYILPEIGDVYRQLGATLPLPTMVLLAIGDFLRSHLFILPLTLAIIFAFPVFLLRIKKVRYGFHYTILKTPILGNIMKEYNLVLFFRSVQSLVKSGLSLVDSVDIAQKTIKNNVYQNALDSAHPILLRGVPLSDILTRFPFLFSTQTRKIIEVGERTGRLDDSFDRITNYYESSFEYKIKVLTTTIEPILMLILGVIVAILAISVFLPIYQLVNVF